MFPAICAACEIVRANLVSQERQKKCTREFGDISRTAMTERDRRGIWHCTCFEEGCQVLLEQFITYPVRVQSPMHLYRTQPKIPHGQVSLSARYFDLSSELRFLLNLVCPSHSLWISPILKPVFGRLVKSSADSYFHLFYSLGTTRSDEDLLKFQPIDATSVRI